jgi:hypothetical protein
MEKINAQICKNRVVNGKQKSVKEKNYKEKTNINAQILLIFNKYYYYYIYIVGYRL